MFYQKKCPRAQRGEEENEAEDEQDDEEIWAYLLSVVHISQNERQKWITKHAFHRIGVAENREDEK